MSNEPLYNWKGNFYSRKAYLNLVKNQEKLDKEAVVDALPDDNLDDRSREELEEIAKEKGIRGSNLGGRKTLVERIRDKLKL